MWKKIIIKRRHTASSVKAIFKKHTLDSILWGLWLYKDDLHAIEKLYATSVAIEFSEPGCYSDVVDNLPKADLLGLARLATDFCLNICNNGKERQKDSSEILYEIFNLMANQFTASCGQFGNFARSLLLYKIIPTKIADGCLRYSIPSEFAEDKGYSIEAYLQVSLVAYAAIHANGKFTDEYVQRAVSDTSISSFATMNTVLSDISSTAVHYRRERRRLNSPGSFKYQPLLIYPLIKPWSHIPKHAKRKRYLAPLPHLIEYKANLGIYHHFLSKHKTDFTTFFGKHMFEQYVGHALQTCCCCSKIINENTITTDYKIPEGVSIPDFLVVRDNKGIIIECKAAVLPLSVYTHGNMGDFKTTVKKLYKAVGQVYSFKNHSLKESIYGVEEWLSIIVTYEPLWGVNSGLLAEIIIDDFIDNYKASIFKKAFEHVSILSVAELDTLLTYVSNNDSLYEIIKKLQGTTFNDLIGELVKKTGKTFKDSYLSLYTDQILKNISPKITCSMSKIG